MGSDSFDRGLQLYIVCTLVLTGCLDTRSAVTVTKSSLLLPAEATRTTPAMPVPASPRPSPLPSVDSSPLPSPKPSISPTPSPSPTLTVSPSPKPSPSPSPSASPSPSNPRFTQGNPCSSDGSTIYFDPATHVCSIQIGMSTRSYRLHVPSTYEPGKGALVINFHGHSLIQNAAAQESGSGMSSHAEKHGYAVAYPDSTVISSGMHTWNINMDPTREDDLLFVKTLVQQLTAMLGADSKRIFMTGASGGGIFVNILATQFSSLFAAGAPVIGNIYLGRGVADINSYPAPASPISMLMINSDTDPTVLFCGPAAAGSGGPLYYQTTSVDDVFAHWSQVNNCASTSSTVPFCMGATPNTAQIDHKKATQCTAGAEVEAYALRGGTHNWYSMAMNNQSYAYTRGTSTLNSPYNSTFPPLGSPGASDNDLIWNFFLAHPKP